MARSLSSSLPGHHHHQQHTPPPAFACSPFLSSSRATRSRLCLQGRALAASQQRAPGEETVHAPPSKPLALIIHPVEDSHNTLLLQQQPPANELRPSKPDSLFLLSTSPLSMLALAALPGAGTVASVFEPIAEVVRSLNLPGWLVHWGHPGNMAVVLFAMGGYGSYLGWQIRLSDDVAVKAKAKDLHPKLLGGMFFFFSLGATGGILSLLTSGKPIFESPHAVTGLLGLALLSLQTGITTFFEGNPSLRSVHGFLGSGIMLLFLVHAFFGLQLGLSY